MTEDLFSSLPLRGVSAPNRVMVSPMCQYSCVAGDGVATDWHHVHLSSRAVGGAGIVMAEAAAVEPRGRISPSDLGIWSAAHAEALAPTAAFVEGQGSVPGIQLAHAGRKASKTPPRDGSRPISPDERGWETIAPAAEPWPYEEGEAPPVGAMDRDDMDAVTAAFVEAAEHAHAAGFEVVEIHAAHGYLLHEFLSPATNTRDDDYGGPFEDRARYPLEVVSAVRDAWPDDRPLFVRISATDWLGEDAWTLADSVRLADRLADAGVDLIDVSSSGIRPDAELPHTGPSYQLPLAERVREESAADVLVGTVGGITEPTQADEIVRNDRADLVIVGREHLRDPYFTLHAARELDAMDRVEVPVQYRRGFP